MGEGGCIRFLRGISERFVPGAGCLSCGAGKWAGDWNGRRILFIDRFPLLQTAASNPFVSTTALCSLWACCIAVSFAVDYYSWIHRSRISYFPMTARSRRHNRVIALQAREYRSMNATVIDLSISAIVYNLVFTICAEIER
jgi:hypothetical protein